MTEQHRTSLSGSVFQNFIKFSCLFVLFILSFIVSNFLLKFIYYQSVASQAKKVIKVFILKIYPN